MFPQGLGDTFEWTIERPSEPATGNADRQASVVQPESGPDPTILGTHGRAVDRCLARSPAT